MCNFLVTFPQSIFYFCLTDSLSEKNYFNHYTVALSIQIDVTINHKIIATFRNRQLCLGIIVFILRGLYTYTSPKSNCCSGPLKYILTQNHWFINVIHCSILILCNTYILVPPIWLWVFKNFIRYSIFSLCYLDPFQLEIQWIAYEVWKKIFLVFAPLEKLFLHNSHDTSIQFVLNLLSDFFSLTWNYYWRE